MDKAAVEIDFIGPFRDICGCGKLSMKINRRMDLLSLIKEVAGRFGGAFEKRLGFDGCNYDGDLAIVIVNGVVVDSSKLRERVIEPGDRITFAPSLVGGG